jgi:GT2 family glycosyltransferase
MTHIPAISVLMPVYNSETYLRQTIQSVLGQTETDFEFIVVDDCSTDGSLTILRELTDPRLRVLQNTCNLGIVATTNRALSVAGAQLIANMDNDDLCLPTRLARQRAYLAAHPETLLVGTEMAVLEHGVVRHTRPPGHPDPAVLKWMFHLSNPIGNPSTMFRRSALGDPYLREAFTYAQDFDFAHRILQQGDIAILPEHLVIYRRHVANASRVNFTTMIAHAAKVLAGVYANLLGGVYDYEAGLVATHLMSGQPFVSTTTARQLARFLTRLTTVFADVNHLDGRQVAEIIQYTGQLWWRAIQATLRAGHPAIAWQVYSAYQGRIQTQPPLRHLARSLLSGLSPYHPPRRTLPTANSGQPLTLNGVHLQTRPNATLDPPTLYVVIDTEAEFDWRDEFARSQTSVRSIAQQTLAQKIFDGYGVRPIYLVDYAVASQPAGYEPLQTILAQRRCAIGAHLHPWITPPFEETLSEYNSYAGNLPASLERRKLRNLVDMIEMNFGIQPRYFKAGRYGLGPHTLAILSQLGFAVDFSILPLTDLRAKGGPDFTYAQTRPYHTDDGLASFPMTRGQTGWLAPLSPRLHSALHSPLSLACHLPGILAHTGLVNTVTLTPEGVTAAEQIKLIQTLVARGERAFTLHYHSPSLAGLTHYVRNPAEVANFLVNIKTVCDYFFITLGGLPGNPADLVSPSQRNQIWPAAAPETASRSPRHCHV